MTFPPPSVGEPCQDTDADTRARRLRPPRLRRSEVEQALQPVFGRGLRLSRCRAALRNAHENVGRPASASNSAACVQKDGWTAGTREVKKGTLPLSENRISGIVSYTALAAHALTVGTRQSRSVQSRPSPSPAAPPARPVLRAPHRLRVLAKPRHGSGARDKPYPRIAGGGRAPAGPAWSRLPCRVSSETPSPSRLR